LDDLFCTGIIISVTKRTKKLKKSKTAAKRESASKLIDAELDSEKEVDEIIRLLTRRQTQ
jgi:hypothetical protein